MRVHTIENGKRKKENVRREMIWSARARSCIFIIIRILSLRVTPLGADEAIPVLCKRRIASSVK